MSLNLTQVASDNFQRANVAPLTSPWTLASVGSQPGLQIVSELCEGNISGGAAQFYTHDLPNDQFASGTVAALPTDENGFMLFVRVTDNGSTLNTWPGYKMEVFNLGSDGQFGVFTPASGAILTGTGLTINPGDVFTLAAIGTTIYVLQNGTVLGSVTDTSYSSGGTALECDASEVKLSNFAIGSASVAAVAITTTSLPNAVIGQPYNQTLAATGGTTPYTWSITSGSLPSGLSLNASTGVISGTPTEGGNFTFTVQVADSSSPAQTATANLGVDGVAGGPQAGGWNEYQQVVQQRPQPQMPRTDWRPGPGAFKKF
jgi:hypothetical protein